MLTVRTMLIKRSKNVDLIAKGKRCHPQKGQTGFKK